MSENESTKAAIVRRITLEDIRALSPKPKMIFYGANTCWWTHDPNHLSRNTSGLPCDPRGGVLLQTENVEGFLNAAEEAASRYGKHGLEAFTAAHHLNCRLRENLDHATCLRTWQEYNDVIDRGDL